jgi:hypothetical protein
VGKVRGEEREAPAKSFTWSHRSWEMWRKGHSESRRLRITGRVEVEEPAAVAPAPATGAEAGSVVRAVEVMPAVERSAAAELDLRGGVVMVEGVAAPSFSPRSLHSPSRWAFEGPHHTEGSVSSVPRAW